MIKKARVIFTKSGGNGGITNKVVIPRKFIKNLEVEVEDRDIQIEEVHGGIYRFQKLLHDGI